MPHRIPLSVLVVHGEPTTRDRLARRLDALDGVSSCDHVDTLSAAAQALGDHAHDVVMSASSLPDGSGAELVAFVGVSGHPAATVLLVDHDDPVEVADAIRSGAHGVSTVDEVDAVLLHSARSVSPGACVLQHRSATTLAAVCPPRAHTLLSPRELDVLTCLALGLTNAETASRLYVSRETVKTHVARVLRKLEVSDRRAAAARASLLGLIPPTIGGVESTPPGTATGRTDHRRSTGDITHAHSDPAVASR